MTLDKNESYTIFLTGEELQTKLLEAYSSGFNDGFKQGRIRGSLEERFYQQNKDLYGKLLLAVGRETTKNETVSK